MMNYLSNGINCEVDCNHDVSNYVIKNTNVLKQQLTNGLSIIFVVNEINKCFCLVKNSDTQHFSFSECVQSTMGLHYFDLAQVKKSLADVHSERCSYWKMCFISYKIEWF